MSALALALGSLIHVSPAVAQGPVESSVRALLSARYGSLLIPNGLRVDHDGVSGLRVWMTLAPPRSKLAQGRTWTRYEGQKILDSVLEDIHSSYPDLEILPSSGIEARNAQGEIAWRQTLADSQIESTLLPPRDPRSAPAAVLESRMAARPLNGERSEPDDTKSSKSSPPVLVTQPLMGNAFPLSSRTSPATLAPFQNAPARRNTANRMGTTLPDPVQLAQMSPSDFEAMESDDQAEFDSGPAAQSTGPAAPSGSDSDMYDLRAVTPTLVTPVTQTPDSSASSAGASRVQAPRRLLYPKDKESMEFEIEDMLEQQLGSVVESPTVRATFERARVVRLFVQFVFRGKRLDNAIQVLGVARDAIKLSLHDRFPGLRIHHRSRFRLREANERFVYDYDLLTLEPHGVETDYDRDPFFRPLRLTRDRVIDLPTAFPLDRNVGGASISYFKRFLSDDNYGDVVSSRSEGLTLKLRKSFFRGFEMAIQASGFGHKVEPVQRGVFVESEGTLGVFGLEAKYQLPYEVMGMRIAAGFTQSFQEAGERAFYLPEDFERFYSLYVAGGRQILDHLIFHVGAIRSVATLEPLFDDETILTVGGGIEYRASPRALLLLEVLKRSVSGDSFSRFGPEIQDRGTTVNVGGVIGTRLGDLEVLIRQMSHSEIQEYQTGISVRW